MIRKPKGLDRFLLALILAVYIFSTFKINSNAPERGGILRADAAGYYLYLPAIFIYQDPTYAFCDSAFAKNGFYPKGYFHHTLKDFDGKLLNKYGCGTALSATPFFLVAHAYGTIVGETYGAESHYQWSWWLASTFFYCLGILCLFRIGKRNDIPSLQLFLVLVGIVFGTNLFHYGSFDGGMSHAFTFGWLSLALDRLSKMRTNQAELKDWLILALACALVVLIRPFNILLLPVLLFAVPYRKLNWSKKLLTYLAISTVLGGMLLALIPLLNNWQVGQYMVYAYGNESFNFSKPHFYKFFFGFEIGAFIYSPILMVMLLVLGGVCVRKKRFLLYSLFLLYYVALAWVMSCWESWQYGCTLGNRPLADWHVFFAAGLLSIPVTHWKKSVVVVCSLTVGILTTYSQILHYQYRHWILDWCHMDKEKFVDVFLKTDSDYTFYCSNSWDYGFAKNNLILTDTSVNREFKLDHQADAELIYLPNQQTDSIKNHRILIEADIRFPENRGDAKIAVHMGQNGKYFDYRQKFIKKDVRKSNKWYPFKLEFHTRQTGSPIDVGVNIIDSNQDQVEIKNLRVRWIQYD